MTLSPRLDETAGAGGPKTRRQRLSTMTLSPRLHLFFLLLLLLTSPLPSLAQTDADQQDQQQQPQAEQQTESSSSESGLDDWTCSNPGTTDSGVVRRGSRTSVCLTVGPGDTDWNDGVQYLRYLFRPTADQYSVYSIPNSFQELVVDSKFDFLHNITVFAASSTSLSWLRKYYDKDNGLIYPFLTAIIDVKSGIIAGIAFDEACIFCGRDACHENTYSFNGSLAFPSQPTAGCAIPEEVCREIAASEEKTDDHWTCDLRLYVVWTGTDDDGNVLSSADSRFSLFEPKQIQQRFLDLLPPVPSFPSWSDINPFDDIDWSSLNPFDGGGGERKDL